VAASAPLAPPAPLDAGGRAEAAGIIGSPPQAISGLPCTRMTATRVEQTVLASCSPGRRAGAGEVMTANALLS